MLLSSVECEFGLLDHLISMEALGDRITEKLQIPKPIRTEQNELLLDYFCDLEIKPEPFYKLNSFIEALNLTHQYHLADVLQGRRAIRSTKCT